MDEVGGPVGSLALVELTLKGDVDRVQALSVRAADYVTLETGAPPAPDWAEKSLTECPPGLGLEALLNLGIVGKEGGLDGVCLIARGYDAPDVWWIGLLMLDPAVRGGGIGGRVVAGVAERARASGAACLKAAVLEANPKGRRFWERQDFRPERRAPPEGTGPDGHVRHVLRRDLEKEGP